MVKFNNRTVSYNILNENKEVISSFPKQRCYSSLGDYCMIKNAKYVEIYNITTKETKHLKDDFLTYIGEAFKLDYEIKKDSFIFNISSNSKFNLLIGIMVRYLHENPGISFENNIDFLESLLNGKCKYRNKLKRMCYFYSQLVIHPSNRYLYGNNHSFAYINQIKLKTYNDLQKAIKENKFTGIIDFFNND